MPDGADWETPCPEREDGQHCDCWYDGEACCACGAPEMTAEQMREAMHEDEVQEILRDRERWKAEGGA